MSVSVKIDLTRIRANTQAIAAAVAVPIYAVVKADAYGLGADSVAATIADLVQAFCVFGLSEARRLKTDKPKLCLGPPDDVDPTDYLSANARPAVSTVEQARRFAKAHPALCVDTGMQRFSCPPEHVGEALLSGDCPDAFTHATRPQQANALIHFTGGRRATLKLHAAGSSLMNDPTCRLDAVRPGLALYRGAARITSPLVELHQTRGPAGYRGFTATRHGIILAGYTSGLRPGPCLLNGRRSRILEVGMQSSFVECDPKDSIGDEVILLGDGLEADQIAPDWRASPQEVLVSLLKNAAPLAHP